MKIRFNRFTHERSFRSPADFKRFAEEQQANFAELESESPEDYRSWGSAMVNAWRTAAGAVDGSTGDHTRIAEAMKRQPAFAFDSPATHHLLLMGEQGRRPAANLVTQLLVGTTDNQRIVNNTTTGSIVALSELAAVLSLEQRLTRSLHGASLRNLQQEHEDRLNDLVEADDEELEAQRKKFDELAENAGTVFGDLEQREAKAVAERDAQWQKTHEEYVDQLQIRTAVRLWAARGRIHRTGAQKAAKAARWFGGLGLVLLIGWIFGGYWLADTVFDNDTARVAVYTASSIATFTLYVWGLRVLIRSMLSQEHLATDASARSALAHTYLALTKQNVATDEDRAIVLATLFAPVSDGLIKDDGMPALSPQSMVMQRITS